MDIIRAIKAHPSKYLYMMGFERKNPAYDEWMRHMLFDRSDWTLQAFRGSGKTTCVSAALALYVILKPNTRIAFMRKTDTDVKEVMSQVQTMIQRPESQVISSLIWGAPIKLVKATQTEISTNLTNDPRGSAQLTGMGINGSLTGKHYDVIFTDDIVNRKDRISRAERENTKSVYMELQNIKNRGGRIINTGTPWHIEDCFSIMPDPEKWDYRSMPDLISDDEVSEIKKRMTPSLFAANYELRHIASDDVIFTNPQVGASLEKVYHAECHIDAAYYGEDYTAFTAMAYHDGKYYVYGRLWRKHILDVIEQIKEDYTRLMLGRLYIETNADKGFAAMDLKKKGFRVVPYTESENKHAKITTSLKSIWPDVVFVEGTDTEYINQICDYTEDAEHDDAPDSAASLALRGKFPKKNGTKSDNPFA